MLCTFTSYLFTCLECRHQQLTHQFLISSERINLGRLVRAIVCLFDFQLTEMSVIMGAVQNDQPEGFF